METKKSFPGILSSFNRSNKVMVERQSENGRVEDRKYVSVSRIEEFRIAGWVVWVPMCGGWTQRRGQ